MFATKIAPAAGTAAALVLGAGAAGAQFSTSGSGCAGDSGTVAHIEGNGFPAVGGTYSIDVVGLPSTPVLLGFGVTAIPPFDLTGLGLPTCTLDVLIIGTIPGVTDAGGVATFSPPSPAVAGQTFHVQGYVADAGASTLGATTELLTVTTYPASGIGAGDLVITEYMNDPNFVGDSNGEWIELFNPTASDVNIEYFTLSDNGADSVFLDNGGAGIVIPAGGYAVIGNDADPLTNGGVPVIFEYDQTGSYFLANNDDEIVLTDYAGTEIDRIEYDPGAGWPDMAGTSIALDVAALDAVSNDLASNWALSTCTLAGTPCNPDTGTPALANDQCLTSPCVTTGSGEVIFSEIMQNPAAVFDDAGEWLELHNTTGGAIDLQGWTLVLGGCTEVISTSVVLPAGGYALFAENADSLTNGGLPALDYTYDVSCFLGNGAGSLQLLDGSLNLVAQVDYDGGPVWPDPNGASMTLDPTKLNVTDMADGANWCEGSTPYGDGDLGTPDAANDTCP
jgi:hypothetical protein